MSVAERNDPRSGPKPYKGSKASEIQGQEKGFHYEWKSMEAGHPQYVERYLRPYEIGCEATGFWMVDKWEVVHRDSVFQSRKRADDAKAVDTTVINTGRVLCRVKDEEWAKHEAYEQAMDRLRSRQLSAPEKQGDQFVNISGRGAGGSALTWTSGGQPVETAAQE